MDQIRAVLDEVARLDREATPGPWGTDGCDVLLQRHKAGTNIVAECFDDHASAQAAARYRTLAPRLAAALAVAVEEHERNDQDGYCRWGSLGLCSGRGPDELCPGCGARAAIARIAAALAGEGPGA